MALARLKTGKDEPLAPYIALNSVVGNRIHAKRVESVVICEAFGALVHRTYTSFFQEDMKMQIRMTLREMI